MPWVRTRHPEWVHQHAGRACALAEPAGLGGAATAARPQEQPALTSAFWAGLWVQRKKGIGSRAAAMNQELRARRGTTGARQREVRSGHCRVLAHKASLDVRFCTVFHSPA